MVKRKGIKIYAKTVLFLSLGKRNKTFPKHNLSRRYGIYLKRLRAFNNDKRLQIKEARN